LRIKMYLVYVIKSFEGLAYIGQTNDINRRLKEHHKGLSGWTKRAADWELVYLEECDNPQDRQLYSITLPKDFRFLTELFLSGPDRKRAV